MRLAKRNYCMKVDSHALRWIAMASLASVIDALTTFWLAHANGMSLADVEFNPLMSGLINASVLGFFSFKFALPLVLLGILAIMSPVASARVSMIAVVMYGGMASITVLNILEVAT